MSLKFKKLFDRIGVVPNKLVGEARVQEFIAAKTTPQMTTKEKDKFLAPFKKEVDALKAKRDSYSSISREYKVLDNQIHRLEQGMPTISTPLQLLDKLKYIDPATDQSVIEKYKTHIINAKTPKEKEKAEKNALSFYNNHVNKLVAKRESKAKDISEKLFRTKANENLEKLAPDELKAYNILAKIYNQAKLTPREINELVTYFRNIHSDPETVLMVGQFLNEYNPKLAQVIQEHVNIENYLNMIQHPQEHIENIKTIKLMKHEEKWADEPNAPNAIKEKQAIQAIEVPETKEKKQAFVLKNTNTDPENIIKIAKYIHYQKPKEMNKILANIAVQNKPHADAINREIVKLIRQDYGIQGKPDKKHSHEVNANNLQGNHVFKEKVGDELKALILKDLHLKITDAAAKAESPEAFDEQVNKIMNDNKSEIDVLKKGQNKTTKILGIKTTSVHVLEKLVSDARKSVVDSPQNKARPQR